MKVIFLDVDGVLNNEPHALELRKLFEEGKISEKEYHYDWDLPYDGSVLPLKHIVEETGAQIVLSSSWRIGCSGPAPKRLTDVLDKYDLKIIDKTCYCVSVEKAIKLGCDITKSYYGLETYDGGKRTILSDRGIEISEWLSRHPEVESYVILDDDIEDIKPFHPNNYIRTKFYGPGLTMELADKAIQILNS